MFYSALLSYYAASSGNFLPTFWDNQSVPSSRVNTWHLKMGDNDDNDDDDDDGWSWKGFD